MKVSLNIVERKRSIDQLRYHLYYINRQETIRSLRLALQKLLVMKAIRHLLLFIMLSII